MQFLKDWPALTRKQHFGSNTPLQHDAHKTSKQVKTLMWIYFSEGNLKTQYTAPFVA